MKTDLPQKARRLQNRFDRFEATVLGYTTDSWIYIDRTNAQLQQEPRRATDAESLKGGIVSPVMSTRSDREYDCAKRRYRVRMHWTWSGSLFTGEVLRPLEPAGDWAAPTPGTVGKLLVNTVCGAG